MFMYGNCDKNDTRYREKVFPYLLEKAADTFNFNDCSFAIQKSKESTARVVGWKELQIVNCYTLECSFCGSDFGKFQYLHFNTDMLQSIGPKFCETIMEFHLLDPQRLKTIQEELEKITNNQMQDPKLMQGQVQGLDEDANYAATVGLLGSGLTKDAVLGIIKDEEDSCQDSDFSGDDEKKVNEVAAQQEGKK